MRPISIINQWPDKPSKYEAREGRRGIRGGEIVEIMSIADEPGEQDTANPLNNPTGLTKSVVSLSVLGDGGWTSLQRVAVREILLYPSLVSNNVSRLINLGILNKEDIIHRQNTHSLTLCWNAQSAITHLMYRNVRHCL